MKSVAKFETVFPRLSACTGQPEREQGLESASADMWNSAFASQRYNSASCKNIVPCIFLLNKYSNLLCGHYCICSGWLWGPYLREVAHNNLYGVGSVSSCCYLCFIIIEDSLYWNHNSCPFRVLFWRLHVIKLKLKEILLRLATKIFSWPILPTVFHKKIVWSWLFY